MLLSTPSVDREFKAPNWNLDDLVFSEKVNLEDEDTSRGFVVAFICNHCPYVIGSIEKFVETVISLQEEGIQVYAIMSNNYEFYTSDGPEFMKEFAKEHGFTFPYLLDKDQSVAKEYGAVCTPDIFGFNAEGFMQYRGNVDGLRDAMLKIKETGDGPEEQSASSGCSIKWK